jgi:exopolysaccharide production protein ExoZ
VDAQLRGADAIGFRFTSPLFFEFVAGMSVAIAVTRIRFPPWAAAGVTLLASAAVVVFANYLPNVPRTITFGISATLIVFGMVSLEPWMRRFDLRALKLLGDASYSIYLAHSLVVTAIASALFARSGMTLAGMTVLVVAATIVGIASYILVERPLLSWMHRKRRQEMPVGAGTPRARSTEELR